MSVRLGLWGAAFAVTLVVAVPPSARAAGPTSADPTQEAKLAEAKQLFREGVALFEAGEIDAALDKFMRSRAAYPSSLNTINAGLSLQRLQRYDEALEMYEEAIAKFSTSLDDQDRRDIAAALATLKERVGTLDVSANVEGNLVVDGRSRGRLPLTMPLRVLPGRHVLRIIRDGYETYEVTLDIGAKELKHVDARLSALQAAGGLRVEDPTNADANVMVDGAVVGQSPWEGSFAPGVHVVQSLSTTTGSRPTLAVVVKGQTTLVRLKSEPLGPVTFVGVSPSTAEIVLDGVPLGYGRWQGALPVGTYVLTAEEEGYFGQEERVSIAPATEGAKTQRLTLDLVVDPNHPRWPKRPAGHFRVAAMASFLVGPSLRSGPEESCGSCGGPVLGLAAGARLGYELPGGLSFDITGGYLSLEHNFDRTVTQTFPKGAPTYTTTYALGDRLRLKGPIIGAGSSVRVRFTRHWSFEGRATVGALFATSVDPVTGKATAGTDTADVSIANADQSVSSVALFVMPELGASYRLGPWQLGASVGAFLVPTLGPRLPRGELAVGPSCGPTKPGAVGCTPVSQAIASERAYGAFGLVSPTISAGYVF